MSSRLTLALVVALLPVTAAAPAAASAPTGAATHVTAAKPPAKKARVKVYKNCKELNRDFPHGVARPKARDKVAGRARPVTTFTVNKAVYDANARNRDADRDGIACEKR